MTTNPLAIARRLGSSGIKAITSVFLNQGCAVCDRRTTQPFGAQPFCIDCQRQLHTAYYPIANWHLKPTDHIPVGALGPYNSALKQAIRSLKYENRPEIAKVLGNALAQRWLSSPAAAQANLYGVPIPLHNNRLAQRGYNQAALIARAFCQASGIPMLAHGLRRQQDTLPQYQLGLAARQKNLKQAFCIGNALQRLQRRSPKLRILLVDDIYTTGATARSAANVLRDVGLSVVGMVALAEAISD